MISNSLFLSAVILLAHCLVSINSEEHAGNRVDNCADGDTVKCLQMDMYRSAKSLLDKDVIDLWGGLKIVRPAGSSNRGGRALEKQIVDSSDPETREQALEDYAYDGVQDVLESRALQFDLAPLASTDLVGGLMSMLPEGISQPISAFFSDEEGRSRRKKLLRALLPLFLALKMKLAGFMVLSYFVIAAIAKKALLASLVSLAIAGFMAIKKMMSQQQSHHIPHHDIGAWASPSFGYSAGGGAGGWEAYAAGGAAGHDIHGAYTNNVAHQLAYSAQKPVAR